MMLIICIWVFVFNMNAQNEILYLYTPNGSRFRAEIEKDEGDTVQYMYEDFYHFFETSGYDINLVTILAPATNAYICQDFAWIISEGGPVSKIITDDIPLFWEDGSYEETTEANAEKVYYEDAGHAAVKSILYPGMYISKWGGGPLVCHPFNLTPYEYSSSSGVPLKKTYYRLKCPSEIKDKTFTDRDVNIRTRCDTINVSNTTIEAGANVTITSNSQIRLLPGFHAKAGSTFHAKIEPFTFDVDNPVIPATASATATSAIAPKQQQALYTPAVHNDATSVEDVKAAEVNISGLAKGIYYVRVITENNALHTVKIIKK